MNRGVSPKHEGEKTKAICPCVVLALRRSDDATTMTGSAAACTTGW
jgi:hypothetical protein